MTPEFQAELLELIDAVLNGMADSEKVARLESMLRGNADAQWLYLRHAHLHGSLAWNCGEKAERAALQRLRAQGPPPPRPRVQRWPGTAWWLAAAAALLAMGLSWLAPSFARRSTVAVLGQAVGAEWEAVGPARGIGTDLGHETLRLKAGLARIDFKNGASVTLEGPAEFRLDGPDRAFLSHGRLTAAVPPAAIGFRIHTPVLDVTDRGTAFGMTVAPSGSSEVMVFQGEVEVDSPDDDQPSQRLLEGSAARAITAHQGPQPAEFDVRPYERAWPMTFGVIGATGVVRFVRPGPKVFPRKIEDNDHLIVIPEREAVTLKEPVIVSITEPGHYDGPFFGLAETLPAGARVRSYLLQFNPVGRLPIVRELIGSITFDRPVLGLIVNSDQLGETDAPLGAEGSAPMGWIARGIEAGDSIELTADRRTLNIYWTAAAGVDQVRVVVAAPE